MTVNKLSVGPENVYSLEVIILPPQNQSNKKNNARFILLSISCLQLVPASESVFLVATNRIHSRLSLIKSNDGGHGGWGVWGRGNWDEVRE